MRFGWYMTVWASGKHGGLPTPPACSPRARKNNVFLQTIYFRLALILFLLLDLAVVLMPPSDGASETSAPDAPPPGGSSTTAKHRSAPWPKQAHANEHLFQRCLANKSPANCGGGKCTLLMAGKMHLAQIMSSKNIKLLWATCLSYCNTFKTIHVHLVCFHFF